jgi:hypothetical protein
LAAVGCDRGALDQGAVVVRHGDSSFYDKEHYHSEALNAIRIG